MVIVNEIAQARIGSWIEVHRALGSGFMESAYEECSCRELDLRQDRFDRQYNLPVDYKGVRLDFGYRLDLLVAGTVVVEIKSVDRLLHIRQAQLLTYLRLGVWKVGLLMNFNVSVLKQGIKRVVLGADE